MHSQGSLIFSGKLAWPAEGKLHTPAATSQALCMDHQDVDKIAALCTFYKPTGPWNIRTMSDNGVQYLTSKPVANQQCVISGPCTDKLGSQTSDRKLAVYDEADVTLIGRRCNINTYKQALLLNLPTSSLVPIVFRRAPSSM